MKRTTSLAWSLFVVTLLLCVFVLILTQAYSASGRTEIQVAPAAIVVFVVALVIATAFVGALVAMRQPRNPIGWLFLVFADGFPLNIASNFYGVLGLPGAGLGPFVNALSTSMWISAPLYALLTFPDGHLPSRRWRPAAWLVAASAPAAVVATVAPNTVVAALVILLALIVTVAALVTRFRHARGVIRAQLKWPASAATAALFFAVVAAVALAVVGSNRDRSNEPFVAILFYALLAALYGIPIAAGVAILRYRLYDIDLLINRTLVYVATSAAIGLTFFGGIIVLQTVLRPLTGGSEFAVAVSTLACFALFQPIRRWIQHGVDRRFYRSRYDSERTLDSFSVRLRDEVDLEAVRAELLNAVTVTVHPANASIWLRER